MEFRVGCNADSEIVTVGRADVADEGGGREETVFTRCPGLLTAGCIASEG